MTMKSESKAVSKPLIKMGKRNRIERHLQILGVPGAYSTNTLTHAEPKRKGRDTILTRMEPDQILIEAKDAYKKRIISEHPDRGGSTEMAKLLGQSLSYVKKWAKRHGVRG